MKFQDQLKLKLKSQISEAISKKQNEDMRFHGINVNPVKKGYLDRLDKATEDLQKANEENEKLK